MIFSRKHRRRMANRRLSCRRLGGEQLEDRRLMTVSQDLVNQLKPYQNALDNALDVATSLPLVGKQLASLQRWNTVFQDSVTSLASQVDALTNGNFQLAVPLPSLTTTFTFDLGLDALLQVHTSGGVSAAINPVLNVGFNLSNGVPALDATRTGLDINFVVGLPNFELTASLNGLMYAKAVDAGTNFSGTLGFVFDTGFRLKPRFSGDAQVRLGLSLSLADPALNASFNPKFFTDFELDWGFDTQENTLKVPQVAFRNFSLDVDSFMTGFLADTVKAVQKFTKPMQPFIDMFEQPVPILSSFDSSETMGDLFLRGAQLSSEQKERFEMMVQIVKAVNSFDFAGSTGGSVVNFGDIQLSGDARAPGRFLFNTGALSNVIDDIINSPQLQALEDKLKTLARYAGLTSNAGFKYPLLENPGPVVGSLLTGIPEVMFSYSTGRQHFELSASLGVGIPDVIGVFLEAGVIFDANLSVGYDTAGLIKFVQDPQKKPENLLHGFYIDNGIDTSGPPIPGVPNPRNTALYLQGFAALKASAGVTVSGGLYADVQIELASNSVSTHVYLDDLITSLASNAKVFKPSGRLYAGAKLELTLPNPVGPDITLFEHQLSYLELLNFNAPRPIEPSVPITIIDVNDQHSVMLDGSKMTARGQVKIQPFHDVPIASGIGYLGDGIRVDYPNEIVLYVQRKNDITTNYYNFIGLTGNIPDGVSIDIVDPFSVFVTEGAPDPRPLQTPPGILLAGGKNVVYRYRESIGDSQAKVLMVGGYGSNVLAGGTMLFGNFIPAARLAQAKSHFGNVSAYDATTQAYIQTHLDSMQAPASPAGIIGSTLSSRRGGLMIGGPGNNSFIAEGPGHYDMVGGTWTNNFTISPSFNGVAATYQIDGGPFGKSTLFVRVPKDEKVVFENSTVDDKYNSSLKALAVTANAGLSATAHGLKKVQILARPGSEVTIGDTSLLNIDFAITGGARLTFGGTNAPDIFSVVTTGHYHGRADRTYAWRVANTTFTEPGKPASTGLFAWGSMPSLPFPTYSITRTFGTNGRTQTIPFAIGDAAASSIALNAAGAADTYSINMGLGAFIDVAVTDSDVSTSNALTVSTGDTNLVYNSVNFTDTTIELDYYTASYIWSIATQHNTIYPFTTTIYMTSVHYTPIVSFSGNVAPKLQAARPYTRVTINRPLAVQPAEFFLGGPATTTPIPYLGLGMRIGVWDVYTDPWTRIPVGNGGLPRAVQIVANGGSLLISRAYNSAVGENPTHVFNVLGNTGALTVLDRSNIIWTGTLTLNIFGSSGRINVDENSQGVPTTPSSTTVQLNVGAGGSLANISGTISMTTTRGLASLTIDDRANATSTSSWQALADRTIIGNLAIHHAVNQNRLIVDRVSQYAAFPRTGAPFAFDVPAPFFSQLVNGQPLPSFPDLYLSTNFQSVRRGERLNDQLSSISQSPGTLSYSATGLPPGLSISSSGLVTGTVSDTATAETYTAKVSVFRNGIGRISSMTWAIGSSIEIQVPRSLSENPQIEGTAPTVERLTATNLFNRPVTFSATDLPPGITLDSSTGRFGGRYTVGSAQNGSYQTTIQATDGVDSTSTTFTWSVTGISLVTLAKQFNRVGDTVDLPINYSIASGAGGTVTVSNLPEGLMFDATDNRIKGRIDTTTQTRHTVSLQIDDGNDRRYQAFVWITLPVGAANLLDFYPIGDWHLHEGQSAFFLASIYNSFQLPITMTASGLPPGLSLNQREGDWWIDGTVDPGAAANSPYRVQLLASDDYWSARTNFEISVARRGTVSFNSADNTQYNGLWDTISLSVTASSTLGEAITYSATGLPPGLSIDPSTGKISGELTQRNSVPIAYKVKVTATTASGNAHTRFNWNFFGSYEGPNVAVIAHPQGPITVRSPLGTELLVTHKTNVGVSAPTDASMRFGYFSFAIRSLAPGQAADLTITGLNLSGIDDYRNYGASRGNPAAHWYRFLFDPTKPDIPGGMQIVDNQIVLHLVDGGPGDHDLVMNGSISSEGGPARRISQPPVIGSFGGSVMYTENGSPVILDSDATITDTDSADFADGRLTVVTAANAQATDRIRVRHTGRGPGQIGVDGFNVLYGGQVMGTFTGASSLVVRLNARATAAAVQALLRSVTFAAVTEAPSALPRRIEVKLTDGDGGTSLVSTSTVTVIAVNDRPIIRDLAGQITYTENGAAVLLDDDVTVTDVDSPNFDSGKLTVAIISNAETTDRLRFKHMGNAAGQIGVSGTTISYGGVAIGSYTGAKWLVVSLNAQATAAAVQALLRSVTYFTVSDRPSTLNRTLRVHLTDGDGGTSTLSYKTIQVVAVNDAPTIGALGPTAIYSVAGPAVLIASTATVNDADSSNFDAGQLTITTITNSQPTDLFAIAHQGTGSNQVGVQGANISFGGTLVGNYSGGSGSNPLTITFNANATALAVQAVLRSVTWRSTSPTPSLLSRTIQVTLTDGDGGLSSPLTKQIEMV